MIYGMLIIVTLLGGDNPHVEAMPVKMVELSACKTEAHEMNTAGNVDKFDISGTPILSKTYTCSPMQKPDIDRLVKDVK